MAITAIEAQMILLGATLIGAAFAYAVVSALLPERWKDCDSEREDYRFL